MKTKSYKLGAVIPCGQYANIQPEIEIEGGTLQEAHDLAMGHVKELFSKYSSVELDESTPQITTTVKLESFNEPGVFVDFDPIEHVYTYEGKKLESASGYTAKYGSKFAGEAIAAKCEKSWGVKKKDILAMWEGNRDVAADFGTALHKALEHYFNFKSMGETIMENTDKEENPALPNHPFLREIIDDFELLPLEEGELVNEVFLTDIKNMRCGFADRLMILDKKKKVCRVQDYKINVDAEEESSKHKLKAPYNELPKNKISKYQVQMSFYADLLEKSGWTVEGLDVFVYEDKWTFYELEVLDIKK